MKDKKTFKEVYNNEEGILIIAVLAAMVMAGVSIFRGTNLTPIVSSMLWTCIVGLAILRVIKKAVEELKK